MFYCDHIPSFIVNQQAQSIGDIFQLINLFLFTWIDQS